MNEENKIDIMEYLRDRRDYALECFFKTGLIVYHGIASRANRRLSALNIGVVLANTTRQLGGVAKSVIEKVNSRVSNTKNDSLKDNSFNLG